MQLRILGPLEVVDASGSPIPLGRNERAMLAVLVLHAGEVVSKDRLIDLLWGDAAPASPDNALQARVSRLRRVLGRDAIATRAPGYVLEVSPQSVDAHRFERLVADARGLSGRDPAAALRLLDDALAMWRGPALADFAYEEFARGEILRLESARRTALECRAQAHIDAGAGPEIVGELEALCRSHPDSERLHGLLMLALYRAGRQADAMRVYDDLRRRLADELGADPSPMLRELYDSIVTQDGRLSPASAGLGSPPPGPRQRRSNLPARTSSFLGRKREQSDVAALVQRHRLVTLVGPGGAGKTSLALEVAAASPDSVYLVELAPVTDASLIESLVGAALGLVEGAVARDAAAAPLRDRIADRLAGENALLVLDNCEHLADACARTVDALLRSSPTVRVLATSREPLGVSGEATWPIPPLRQPDWPIPIEALESYDSVRLFCERASAADPSFRLDPTTAPAVAQICARLDGLPLAIELAAARVRTLAVTDIASRLDDRFRLLEGGARTADPRQQTLRGAVDWSYGLLTDEERTLFARLTVFKGAFTLAAAERVSGYDGLEVLELLPRLVDRSLVVHDNGRYWMLETLREYAREKLDASGGRDVVARRHAELYHERADRSRQSPGLLERVWLVEVELDNYRAAIDWALSSGACDIALGIAGGLGWFWFLARQPEGRRRLHELLDATADELGPHRAIALQAAAFCDVYSPSPQSQQYALTSAAMFEELGRPWDRARSLILAAYGDMRHSRMADAAGHLRHAEALVGELDDVWGRALVLYAWMSLHHDEGNVERAVDLGTDALRAFRDLGDEWGVAATLELLGILVRMQGDRDRAESLAREALSVSRTSRLPYIEQAALTNLGTICSLDARHDEALRHFEQALELADRLGDKLGAAATRHMIGAAARRRGDLDEAREHLAASVQGLREAGATRSAAVAETLLASVLHDMGQARAAIHRQDAALAAALDSGDRAALAQALEGAAHLASDLDAPAAARMLGVVSLLRRRGADEHAPGRSDEHAPRRSDEHAAERHDATAAERSVRITLGDAEFDSLFRSAADLSTEQAVTLARTTLAGAVQ